MTATPYALVCYPNADRPFPPPLPPLDFVGPDKPPDVGPPPRTPLPLSAPRTHPGPTRTYKTSPASCSRKKRKNGKEERIFQESYRAQSLGTGLALH